MKKNTYSMRILFWYKTAIKHNQWSISDLKKSYIKLFYIKKNNNNKNLNDNNNNNNSFRSILIYNTITIRI